MNPYHRLAEKITRRLPRSFVAGASPTDSLAARLSRASASHRIAVSFDAFDTLITRPLARPDDLFLVVGRQLAQKRLAACTPEQWQKLRRDAERHVRRLAGDREVTLAEIYRHLASAVPTLDADRARAIEISVEKALVRPIAANVEVLSRTAEHAPTCILSDIYLDESDLREMCAACGIDVATTPVHASSTSGETKGSGRLFRRSGLPRARRRIHVGDNLFADGWRALHAGYRALPFTEADPSRLERLLGSAAIGPAILRSALAGSARSARLRSSARDPTETAVASASSGFSAPLLLAFVVWILVRAKTLGIGKLYFLARDGEILFAMARRIVDALGLEIELRYLYVSRQALHLPALVTLAHEDFERFGFAAGQALGTILGKLELTRSGCASERLRSLGFALDAPLTADEIEDLKRVLRTDHVLRAEIEACAATHRAMLIDYLRQEQMLGPESFAVVDIGWRGNLQRSLAKVLQTVEPGAAGRMSGFYYGLYSRPTGAGRLEAFIDRREAAGLRPFVRGSMFEALCAARHGTTLRYARGQNGRVAPVLAAPDNPEADAWGLAIQQEVIIGVVEDLLTVLSLAGENLLDHEEALTKASVAVAAAFVGLPTRAEALTLGSFPHAADQSHVTFDELAPALPLAPTAWLQRYKARASAPMISYWPEASLVRSMPTPIAHAALKSLARLRARRHDRRRSDGSALSLSPTIAK